MAAITENKYTDPGSGLRRSRAAAPDCRDYGALVIFMQYETRGENYHPCAPTGDQCIPTGRVGFKLGSWALSAAWSPSDRESKEAREAQHIGLLFGLQVGLLLELFVSASAGFSEEAVTLVTKAMAATKDTMHFWKSNVENVVWR
jgi:hypothetical protein